MEWGAKEKKKKKAIFLKITCDSAARSPVRCKPERFRLNSSRLHESQSRFRSHTRKKGKQKKGTMRFWQIILEKDDNN